MGFLSPPRPAAPPPVAAPILPPKNVTIGTTRITRKRQRSSLANAEGQNRTLLNDPVEPLG